MKEFKDISGPDMSEWCEYLADDNAIHLSKAAAEDAGFGPFRVRTHSAQGGGGRGPNVCGLIIHRLDEGG